MTTANVRSPIDESREDVDPPHAEPAWDVATLFPNQGQWSEEEYFALSTNRQVELSDGRIEVLPMPTRLHAAIAFLMCTLLRAFVREDELALVLTTTFSVRLWPGKLRQPDVMYMSGQNVARQHETHWDGADLAVEIVSDEGRERDLVTKRREYARAGIAEYWIIDPLLRQVTILRLDGDHYIEAGTYAPGDTAASVLLPGFNVAVTDIFNAR
jgi:Uma2 family endonuclease